MKLIELSKQGKHRGKYFAMVSDEDYEYVNKFRWQIMIRKYTSYAITRVWDEFGNRKNQIQLHRFILGVYDDSIIIDHKDRNGLNCQRDNIRIATRAQNNCNSKKDIGLSKYIGVFWKTKDRKWIARVSFNNKRYHVGSFDNEEEAGKARDKKALELHGEFVNLNFPL